MSEQFGKEEKLLIVLAGLALLFSASFDNLQDESKRDDAIDECLTKISKIQATLQALRKSRSESAS